MPSSYQKKVYPGSDHLSVMAAESNLCGVKSEGYFIECMYWVTALRTVRDSFPSYGSLHLTTLVEDIPDRPRGGRWQVLRVFYWWLLVYLTDFGEIAEQFDVVEIKFACVVQIMVVFT